jgi:hypothetical protein
MASYYSKFLAKIKATTTSGMTITVECPSPIAMLDEAIGMAFNQHGEAHVRAMFEKALERRIQFKKNYEKEKQNVG